MSGAHRNASTFALEAFEGADDPQHLAVTTAVVLDIDDSKGGQGVGLTGKDGLSRRVRVKQQCDTENEHTHNTSHHPITAYNTSIEI
jgi:hypothetical protein